MNRSMWLIFGLVALGMAAVPACGDDDSSRPDVADTTGDQIPDTADTTDTTDNGDGAPPPLNCDEVSTCMTACGTDDSCAQDCMARTCPPAAWFITALSLCTGTNCATECDDLSASGCATCISTECTAQSTACDAATCTPTELSCAATISCMYACGEDTACIGACEGYICTPGSILFGELMDCSDLNCAADCVVPSSTACGACLNTNCQSQAANCTASVNC